jgi:hypothetical protein
VAVPRGFVGIAVDLSTDSAAWFSGLVVTAVDALGAAAATLEAARARCCGSRRASPMTYKSACGRPFGRLHARHRPPGLARRTSDRRHLHPAGRRPRRPWPVTRPTTSTSNWPASKPTPTGYATPASAHSVYSCATAPSNPAVRPYPPSLVEQPGGSYLGKFRKHPSSRRTELYFSYAVILTWGPFRHKG